MTPLDILVHEITVRGFLLALQALAAIPSINSEAVQQRLDHVRTYYELLNMPFEASHWDRQPFSFSFFPSCKAGFRLPIVSFSFAGSACLHHRASALVYTRRVSQILPSNLH